MWNGACVAVSKLSEIIICDAGPLIHLDELGCFDLLMAFQTILVPEIVWEEVQDHRPSALRHRNVHLTLIRNIPEQTPSLQALTEAYPIDPGEDQAMRLMQQYPEATLLTDDGIARVIAVQLGYRVHGTIAVVLLGLQSGRRSKQQVLNLLKHLRQRSTLYLRKSLLESIITEVEEGST
jgi:predicted nucleic acid-binding protein